MRPPRSFLLGLVVGSASCGPLPAAAPAESAAAPPPEARPEAEGEATRPARDARCPGEQQPPDDGAAIEVIRPDTRVPPFRVTTTDCRVMDSAELVGKEPFVLLFFSSWCRVCEYKIPLVRAVMDQAGRDILLLGVALDEDDTWLDVESFLERHRLTLPVIRGHRYPRFTTGYNPFQGVPVVVVVGRNGIIMDLQVGLGASDHRRLIHALEAAREAPVDAGMDPADG